MGDPFLNYFALVSACFRGGGAVLRHHRDPRHSVHDREIAPPPHQDAIYAAGWVSLFTLHALWPFLWIWAMAYRPERGWGFFRKTAAAGRPSASEPNESRDLRRRVAELETQIEREAVMELLLILIYVSICYVIFKLFRIPVNQWSLATAALGGIIGIALILLIMNYNHPFTTNARIYFAVTPVLPAVKGRVIEVPVKANTPLKEGDELFRIDPRPYEYVVARKRPRSRKPSRTSNS